MWIFFSRLFQNRKRNHYRKRINGTIGCYFPAFFEMNLDIYGDMDINKLSEKEFALFLHEYTHFLQDVSTYYGMSNVYAMNEVIKSMHRNVTSSLPNGGKFKTPVDIMSDDPTLEANLQLRNLTMGTERCIGTFEVAKIEQKSEAVPNNPYVKQIDNVYVTTTKGNVFQFGALALMENMAYLMEQICVSECEPSPEYPYSAAEKVANYIAPAIGKDKLMVLALCDVSLQASNPGHYFYDTLELIRKGIIAYSKPEDVYDDFLRRQVVAYHSSTIPSYQGQFRKMADIVIEQEQKFIATPQLSVFWKWIENAINYSYNLRVNHRNFILDIAKTGSARTSKVFADYVNVVGTPLMMNKCGKYYCIPSQNVPGDGMCYYRAMREFFSLLVGRGRKCHMKNWCKQSGIKVDCRCHCSPWKHLKDKEKCPYAVVWGSLGLEKYRPYRYSIQRLWS